MWLEVFLFGVLVLLLQYWLHRPKGLPPGPLVIPYLGCNPVINLEKVRQYREKYGDIFKIEMGPTKLIFICNYKLIKEAFSKAEFADRPYIEAAHLLTHGKEAGVIMSNGERWQNARRFLLRNLRDLGMGKSYLDGAIQQEAQTLVEDFRAHAGTPANFPKSINVAVLNVVWQLVASKRYDLDDPRVLDIVNLSKEFDGGTIFVLFQLVPVLKKIIPSFIRKRILQEEKFEAVMEKYRSLGKDITTSHRATLDPEQPRDVVDEYLIAMDAKADIATYFSELDLMKITMDLFSAGFDTTSNMLRWTILYMAKYPEVQQRVQKQIDEVVPPDTLPSYQHKSRLPLVEAIIHEVLRKSSLIALGVQHSVNTDVHLAGHLIPKGAFVFGCSVCAHEDPQYWDQPHDFKIDRFLDSEGKFTSQKEGFLPFGIGRRSCLGEALARMELYIFTSALLQNFTFSMPEGSEPDLQPSALIPLACQPKDQDIMITIRKPQSEST